MRKEYPVCEYFKQDRMIWQKIVAVSNMPKNSPCPFPKGNYTIKDYVLDESNFSIAPPGRYSAVGKLIESGEILTFVEISVILKI